MKKIVISALAIAAMVSCSKTEIEPGGDTSNAIVFGGSIEVDTKRTDASVAFDNGEVIGIFGYSMATAAPTTDFTAGLFLDNVPFTYNGTKFTSTPASMWQSGKAHNFYAYYPTTLTVTNTVAGATAPLTVEETTGIVAANDVMVAKVETPVYDGMKNTEKLTFRHILSKVKFKIKKDKDATPNAVLSNVEFKMKSKAGSVNLMTGMVVKTPGATLMSRDLTAAPINVNSTTPVDVSGNWMVLPTDDVRDIIMTINDKPMRLINATIITQAGKVTTITIIVKDNGITFTSEIEAWDDDRKELPDMKPELSAPAIRYGKLPYNQVGPIAAYTTDTHNDKFGAGATNGTYYADAATAYAGELPYYIFEVAKTDAYNGADNNMNWTALQGVKTDRNDNVCLQAYGVGWRLPRLSELRLMYENRAALNISVEDFTPLTAGSYWSATEVDGSNALPINFSDGTALGGDKTLTNASVRCIKELPVPVLEPVIVEYGIPPYSQVGILLKGVTYGSYNIKYGAGNTTNGAYRANADAAYLNEKPFYKFEVAREDAYNGVEKSQGWAALQGTASDRLDNICVKVHGAGWHLPRLSEMRLIYENRDALNSIVEFKALTGTYWSATEVNGTNAWSLNFGDGTTPSGAKTLSTVNVRCVKEIPYVPTGPVLEYSKAQATDPIGYGSTTDSYNGLYGENKANPGTNGAYYETEPKACLGEKPYYKFEVALTDAYDGSTPTKGWKIVQGTTLDNGICVQVHGAGWRMPRTSELRLIYQNRAILTATGFAAFVSTPYWSATEFTNPVYAWSVHLGNGEKDNGNNKTSNYRVRCIKEL